MVVTLVMAPKSVRFRRHDHLVSVLFGDLLSHSYNITFSMFLYLVIVHFVSIWPMNDILLQLLDGCKVLLKEKNDLLPIQFKAAIQKGAEHLAQWKYL